MEYQASENLANILISHGFEETTGKRYPDHFEMMNESGYNPQSIKRSFAFGRKMSIIFDYIDIKSYGAFTSFSSYGLKEDELKSIFTFLKLPDSTQRTIKKRYSNILEIADRCEKISENPERYKGVAELKLREIFSTIEIK